MVLPGPTACLGPGLPGNRRTSPRVLKEAAVPAGPDPGLAFKPHFLSVDVFLCPEEEGRAPRGEITRHSGHAAALRLPRVLKKVSF